MNPKETNGSGAGDSIQSLRECAASERAGAAGSGLDEAPRGLSVMHVHPSEAVVPSLARTSLMLHARFGEGVRPKVEHAGAQAPAEAAYTLPALHAGKATSSTQRIDPKRIKS